MPDSVLTAPGSAAALASYAADDAFSFTAAAAARLLARGWIFGPHSLNWTSGLPAAESEIARFTSSISDGVRLNMESDWPIEMPMAYTVFSSSVVRGAGAARTAADLGAAAAPRPAALRPAPAVPAVAALGAVAPAGVLAAAGFAWVVAAAVDFLAGEPAAAFFAGAVAAAGALAGVGSEGTVAGGVCARASAGKRGRSEEDTSELQSPCNIVFR